MGLNLFISVVGFAMLYFGAEWLVRGSSSMARAMGISPLVIGLTVVAFGTSAPELVVSLISSIQGKSMIAVGNVVGSNICNIALVLGLASIFQPITSSKSVVRRDIPIMLGISVYLFIISLNSGIGRIEGMSLFGGVILYTIFNYYIASKESRANREQGMKEYESELEEIGYVATRSKQILFILVGIAGVVIGAQAVVDSSVKIMKLLGVREKFIGLTIVAFGTSLPELATSEVAALRKEMDISIGNLVGSNVFNILSVLGVASMIRPITIPGGFFGSGLFIDYLVMIFTCLLPWFMMRKQPTLSRRGGAVLLACYAGYICYLVVKA